MVRRIHSDESGLTMALTVIMIALIGVMGAGLLVFAVTDLNTVSEENRGQRAFEMAEAGNQMARRQLRIDPLPTHYDMDAADIVGPVVDGVGLCDVPAAQALLDGLSLENITLFPLLGSNRWLVSPTDPNIKGMTKSDLDGVSSSDDSVTVSIQWLKPNPQNANEQLCAAPVTSTEPGTSHFRVISTGKYNGAKRKIEVVYKVYDSGIPKAFFTSDDTASSVTVNGNALEIQSMSVFSLGDIRVNGGLLSLPGEDKAYKSWAETSSSSSSYPNKFNKVPRRGGLLNAPQTAPGYGAAGDISASGLGGIIGGISQGGKNQEDLAPQPTTTQMTFPFNPDAEPNLQLLKDVAREQGNYHSVSSNDFNINIWPSASTYRTIYYVEFLNSGNNEVKWSVNNGSPGSCAIGDISLDQLLDLDAVKKGVIVVEGGSYKTSPGAAKAPFAGVVLVRGDTLSGGSFGDGSYTSNGNTCMRGYANIDGPMTLSGNISPLALLNTSMTPGFYNVEQYGWRELYK